MGHPSYQTNDPKGWCGDPRRGAAMGRPAILDANPDTFTGKLYLQRVRLNSGGYDRNGTYFGISDRPLYWCADDSGEVDFMIRALDREDAKGEALAYYPGARFYR